MARLSSAAEARILRLAVPALIAAGCVLLASAGMGAKFQVPVFAKWPFVLEPLAYVALFPTRRSLMKETPDA